MTDGYDVIVAGGGTGGFAAAIGAARCGARVLLVEKHGFAGGAATASNVLALCGLYQNGGEHAPVPAVGGAIEPLMAELSALGMDVTPHRNSSTGNWLLLLEPERLKLAMDRCLAAEGVETLFHARTTEVTLAGSRLEHVDVELHEGPRQLSARTFVDATGDAHIGRRCDAAVGDVAPVRPFQPYTSPIRIGGLPAGLKIDKAALERAVEDYNRSGDYPIHRPGGGFFAPVRESTDMWWMVIDQSCQTATSAELSAAETYARAAARDYVEVLRGVQPETAGAELVQAGPQVGIREGRHCRTVETLAAVDLLAGRTRPDGVARATWPIEDYTRLGKAEYSHIGGAGYAHIPLAALRAKSAENLFLAGRAIGADPRAYASIRVMGTAFATGFAAGIAAAHPAVTEGEIVTRITEKGGLI